eukprot:TRINITY_DN22525_c0_g1_i1.p1 TRINITY_DN22525_c0_g1~~TRINITY_DN22525_c0_g1_i1.p1  ORF type:complete len:230 (-),score=32.55 TRINITY_DN22525_c0_g1_i1:111-743(-)
MEQETSRDWKVGETFSFDDMVNYENSHYKCTRTHTVYHASWIPTACPQLWVLFDARRAIWNVGKTYQEGDIVIYEENQYQCVKNHLATDTSWTPPTRTALWTLSRSTPAPSSGGNSWSVGDTYVAGTVVTYKGKDYRCAQGHTVYDAAWTPIACPFMWTIDGEPSWEPKEWNRGEKYLNGDIVVYAGKEYGCIQEHTESTTSGVFFPLNQ